MGRQLRRVPLDFDWPLNKTWLGFINPYFKFESECKACDGSGYSPEAKHQQDRWYGHVSFHPSETGSEPLTPDSPAIRKYVERQVDRTDQYRPNLRGMTREQYIQVEGQRLADLFNEKWQYHLDADDVAALVAAERIVDLTHNWSRETGWQKKDPPVMPTPEEVNAWAILTPFGHDSINSWVCIKAKCKRLGVSCKCGSCKGHGNQWKSKSHEALAKGWKEIKPPKGKGYQLWETVSEGSPITPVFAKPEELAAWLVANDDSITKDTTFDGWMKFILGDGWAPSMVGDASGFRSGVAVLGERVT